MVSAGEAFRIAREWVQANRADIPGFTGAYTVGSINGLPDDAPVPATSDLDIMVVVDVADAPPKRGKMLVDGLLLEVTYLALDDVADPERVLGHYHHAPGVATARILADPNGHLDALQREVQRLFDDPEWVQRRVDMARDTVLHRLDGIEPDAPLEAQVMSVLFAVGGVPHILLVAAGRNPTVRKRFEATRALLDERGSTGSHDGLLALVGSGSITPQTAMHHLEALEPVFDVTGRVLRAPVPYATDLLPESRPLAIGGSCEAIHTGYHREAMWWIAVTFTRCMTVLQMDAPEDAARAEPSFLQMLADLGIASSAAIAARSRLVRQALPGIEELARVIRLARP